jgi:hypothetical protein
MIKLFLELYENHMEVFAACIAFCITAVFLSLNKITLPLMQKGMELALTISYYPFCKKNRKRVVPNTRLEQRNKVDVRFDPCVYYGTLKTKVWHYWELQAFYKDTFEA